jgi:hypothetical protein
MKVVFTRSTGWRRWYWKLTDEAIGVNAGSVATFRMRFFCKRDFKKYYLQMKKKRDYWPRFAEVEIGE